MLIPGIKGKKFVVTGGSGHIGLNLASTLCAMNATVILVDRHFNKSVEKLIDSFPNTASFYNCDLEREFEIQNFLQRFNEEHADLDVLVNNASFTGDTELIGWATDFSAQSPEVFGRACSVNLQAAFSLSQGLSKKFSTAKNVSIINISSIYGHVGPDWDLYRNTALSNPAGYAASKGGLLQLTRWLATTLAPEIRVNSVSPGGIFRDQDESFIKRYLEKTPLRRMAKESDITNAIIFLASDLSSYITGHDLIVDGGFLSK